LRLPNSGAYGKRRSHIIYFLNYKPAVACTGRAVHPHLAKFSEAVTNALSTSQDFEFELDVLPQEFRGLSEKERRVVDVDEPNKELVRKVIESKVGSTGNRI
jgi:threonine synthase